MALIMKLNIVNKYEYEEQDDYREIVLKIPNEKERLERDFRYLGLDYNNLLIQDTHILTCEVIDKSDPVFSEEMSSEIMTIIVKANELGYTTPYQDIKKLYSIMNSCNNEDKYKLLAILESRRKDISNMKDVIKFASNMNCFELFNVYTEEELARKLIYNQEIYMEDLMDYADLNKLGKDISEFQRIIKTDQGYLRQNKEIEEQKVHEEEEEFE